MNDEQRREADKLLSRLETAIGQIPEREANAALIKEMIEATGGLRTLLDVVRSH